jgi:hypothetical protein
VAGRDQVAVDEVTPDLAAEQAWLQPGGAGAVRGEHVDRRVPIGEREELVEVGAPERAHP